MLLQLFLLMPVLVGCGANSSKFTAEELSALAQVLQEELQPQVYEVVTDQMLTEEMKSKFPAVKKILKTASGNYGFICTPVGYNGPMTIALAIDGKNNKTLGLHIIKHIETEHYVRDMTNTWFTNRFTDKSIAQYLEVSPLEAQKDNQIIIITGATVTTQAVVNGANAAIGLYKSCVLEQEADPVSLVVEGFVGPVEN